MRQSGKTIHTLLAVPLFMLISMAVASAADKRAIDTEIKEQWRDPIYRAYDFWIGSWENNWRFYRPNEFFHMDQGAQFQHWVFPALDGKALIEMAANKAPAAGAGLNYGFSLRYYDPGKDRWVMAQHWPGAVPRPAFTSQLQGFKRHGRLQVFFSALTGNEDEKRTTRYTFSDIRPGAFRWDGAGTTDGRTWQQGSIAEFVRMQENIPWSAAGEGFLTYTDGSACPADEHRAFDFLDGNWEGSVTLADGKNSPASLSGYKVLDGCAVISFLNYRDGDRSLTVFEGRGYSDERKDWVVVSLDNQMGTTHTYEVGALAGNKASFYRDDRFLIVSELDPMTPPDSIEIDPASALQRTVWTEISGSRIRFERQGRPSQNEDWQSVLKFILEKK